LSASVIRPIKKLSIMKKTIHLVHGNGENRILHMSFCWAGFFIPTLWAISEGLWRLWALSLINEIIHRLFGETAVIFTTTNTLKISNHARQVDNRVVLMPL